MLLETLAWAVFARFMALGENVSVIDDDLNYPAYYSDDEEIDEENVTVSVSTNGPAQRKVVDKFYNYRGDLVGWRDVTTLEFPYVVSIMHAEYFVHVCTGILVTVEVVLTFTQCVTRKKTVAGQVSQKLVELSSMTVVAGLDNMEEGSKSVTFRDIIDMVTPYPHNFKGQVIFLIVRPISFTFHHRPIKLYSTDVDELSRKFEEEAQKGFCEIVTWRETIVCPDGAFLKPTKLEAYRVKIGDPELCAGQTHLLGVRTIGEWSVGHRARRHCFVGMGGRHCGSAPGAPIVCRGAVYGVTSIGSSCSEFGDFGYFVPLNSSEIKLLYDRAYPIERSGAPQSSKISLLLIGLLTVSSNNSFPPA